MRLNARVCTPRTAISLTQNTVLQIFTVIYERDIGWGNIADMRGKSIGRSVITGAIAIDVAGVGQIVLRQQVLER